jgi:hypothetical protein
MVGLLILWARREQSPCNSGVLTFCGCKRRQPRLDLPVLVNDHKAEFKLLFLGKPGFGVQTLKPVNHLYMKVLLTSYSLCDLKNEGIKISIDLSAPVQR